MPTVFQTFAHGKRGLMMARLVIFQYDRCNRGQFRCYSLSAGTLCLHCRAEPQNPTARADVQRLPTFRGFVLFSWLAEYASPLHQSRRAFPILLNPLAELLGLKIEFHTRGMPCGEWTALGQLLQPGKTIPRPDASFPLEPALSTPLLLPDAPCTWRGGGCSGGVGNYRCPCRDRTCSDSP